jgi:hypothetical protein
LLLDLLCAQHPTYKPGTWAKYDALYRGGEVFRESIAAFLPKNPQEPAEVYSARQVEAPYVGYVGPICDWFAAKLFSASLVVRASSEAGERIEPDLFYASWKEDVDGAGTDLVDFVRQRFTSALIKGRAWWCVELPDDDGAPPVNKAHYQARGLGEAYVYALENEQVLDFDTDERGELTWAIVYTLETPRATPTDKRSRIVETWRVYDRATVETFTASYDPGANEERPKQATSTGKRPHGFARVPLVCLGFVGTRAVRLRVGQRMVTVSATAQEGFWLLARLAEGQVAHFRNSAALDWNVKRTCYAMPVFEIGDEGKPPVMGAGYYIQLAPGDKANWIGPPTGHLDVLRTRINDLKDEIYRVANQMAQGVSNNAAAVGRSGESKQVDADSTEVVLRVYGAIAKEAIERTYSLLSEGRGEPIAWSIEGFDVFALSDVATVVAAALEAQALAVPSATFRRELMYRIADAFLPNADQATKDAIRNEIDAGVMAEGTVPPPKVPPVEEELDGDDDDEPDSEPPAAT